MYGNLVREVEVMIDWEIVELVLAEKEAYAWYGTEWRWRDA